jgi:hypothetical protein
VIHSLLADLVVLLHLAFILFASAGGLLVLRWPRVAWLHLPAVAWGVWIELAGRVCPLTPLENWLRRTAGSSGYDEGFIEHHLLPLVYPAALTREAQVLLAASLVLVNLVLYGLSWRRARAFRTPRPRP